MQTVSPGQAMLPLSQGRGRRAQAQPAQGAFQDVFQGRLAVRLASRDRQLSPGERQSSLEKRATVSSGASTPAGRLKAHRSRTGQETASQAGPQPDETRLTSSAQEGRKQRGMWRSQKQTGAEAPFPGLAAGAGQRAMPTLSSTSANTAATSSLPHFLRDLMTFLESQPNQTLQIPPGRAPQVAALLLRAGLPQEEVERLLFSPGVQERGLSAAALATACSGPRA